jgi:uncharacterized damage-inducible protein DinB
MLMTQRAKELAARFTTFNDQVIAFVENCSDEDWQKVCAGEEWTVGVVAHHLAAGHYGALDWAERIVAGEPLPDLNFDTINQMNAQHAQQHADCTKQEVLTILRERGSAIAASVGGLTDADLDRTAHLALIGGDISTQQFIENIIINSGGEHLSSMKMAITA